MSASSRFWSGDRGRPNERFRVELLADDLLFVWFDPNPHGGLDVGQRVGFDELLQSTDRQEAIREACGEQALAEVIAAVRGRVRQAQARAAIDEVTREFFGAFTNKGKPPEVDALYRIFLTEAVVTKCAAGGAEVCTLAQFVEPRRALLTNGRLIDFEERETSARTDISGAMAQRFSVYEKSGTLDGQPFTGRGTKMLQLVLVDGAWKISALAWEDAP